LKLVRIAQLRQPQPRLRGVVFVVDTDDAQAAFVVNAQQFRVLGAAGRAPGGPYVHQHRAAYVGLGDARGSRTLRAQRRQIERRKRFADQRRRQLMRVVQAEPAYSNATITTNAVNGMNRLARLTRPSPS
jgi:hypothetical protein